MNAIRIRRRLVAPIAELPELSSMLGKDVEIIVLEPDDHDSSSKTDTHFRPVGHWEGPLGELDRLIDDVAAGRDADIELDRESRP